MCRNFDAEALSAGLELGLAEARALSSCKLRDRLGNGAQPVQEGAPVRAAQAKLDSLREAATGHRAARKPRAASRCSLSLCSLCLRLGSSRRPKAPRRRPRLGSWSCRRRSTAWWERSTRRSAPRTSAAILRRPSSSQLAAASFALVRIGKEMMALRNSEAYISEP